jgi:uncharacterized protein
MQDRFWENSQPRRFGYPKKAEEMFAEDGAFEMPYLDSLGFPRRYEGREEVEGFFKFVRDL